MVVVDIVMELVAFVLVCNSLLVQEHFTNKEGQDEHVDLLVAMCLIKDVGITVFSFGQMVLMEGQVNTTGTNCTTHKSFNLTLGNQHLWKMFKPLT